MTNTPTTVQELTDLVISLSGKNKDKNSDDYKYVIYVRKSTDEKGKQYRSLGDQKAECKEYAESLGLRVVEVIEEAESAKEAGIRIHFDKMIKDIEKGKFDAILAWHPDRLARNMKDAGTIIDLLDRNIIKDLKFKSFSFESTTSGKMLLGLSFVLAKEYTDKLSDDVSRGNRHNVVEGKVNSSSKHGYYKDRNKISRPDGENFKLIKNAWSMRLEGKGLDEIAEYLNKNKYSKARKTGNEVHTIQKMDKKRLSDMFRNPFYAGVMRASGEVVNLVEVANFIPVVTVREFCSLNKIDNINKTFVLNTRVNRGVIKALMLRGKVTCGHCGRKLTAGITNKKEKSGLVRHYFYYRCATPKCSFFNKSVRAKVIVNYASEYLEQHKFNTEANYKHYVDEMSRVTAMENKEVTKALAKLKLRLRELQTTKQRVKDFALDSDDILIRKEYENDLIATKADITLVEAEIERTEKLLKNGGGAILTYDKFHELFEILPMEVKKPQPMERLDLLLGKIFTNFTITDNKVSEVTLNSPFKEFVKTGQVTVSESKRTRTSDLFDVNEAL